MAGKEIQQLAIRETSEVIGWQVRADWGRELPQMEALILNHITNPLGEFQSDAVQNLIHRIANTGEFLLALVFNQDYTKVTALPLPEVFEDNSRIQLASSIIGVREYLRFVGIVIEQMLDTHPVSGTTNRVIVVEQNMNEFGNKHACDKKALLIGMWNFQVADQHNQSKQYNTWIRAVSDEFNGTAPSGKKRKIAV